MLSIYTAIDKTTTDAILPTICYTGTEYGEWETLFKKLNTFKNNVEKKLHIYCLEPALIGAPEFWWALNGRYMQELIDRFKFYSPCVGCRLYCYAVMIPLCNQIHCGQILCSRTSGSLSSSAINECSRVLYYCKSLLSSFGINLLCCEPDDKKQKYIDIETKKNKTCRDDTCSSCILKDNFLRLFNDEKKFTLPENRKFFEHYAIPSTAKIISRVLAGKPVNYQQEVFNTLRPEKNIKLKKDTAESL